MVVAGLSKGNSSNWSSKKLREGPHACAHMCTLTTSAGIQVQTYLPPLLELLLALLSVFPPLHRRPRTYRKEEGGIGESCSRGISYSFASNK